MRGKHLGHEVAHQRQRGKLPKGEQFGSKTVVYVMGIIGDIVGDGARLRFQAGEAVEREVVAAAIIGDFGRNALAAVGGRRPALPIEQRAVVLDEPLQRLPGEIEAVEGGVAFLQAGHDRERLRVVVEAAEPGKALAERALAGMAERRMPKIMRQRHRFGQIFLETQRPRNRSR